MTTKADQERYRQLHELGCICCLTLDNPMWAGPIEMHHIVDKGYRKHSGGNAATIPLCRWHHQAVPPLVWMSKKVARGLFGPALADGKTTFQARWGTERDLLERVNRMLMVMRNGGAPDAATPTD